MEIDERWSKWTDKLIEEVKRRPQLYDKSVAIHSDKNVRNDSWQEIYSSLISNWHSLSPEEQIIRGKEIQSRWRNLRTCFKRELNEQSRISAGQPAKRRRQYIYYDKLLFLIPYVTDREKPEKFSEFMTLSYGEDRQEPQIHEVRSFPTIERTIKNEVETELVEEEEEEEAGSCHFSEIATPSVSRVKNQTNSADEKFNFPSFPSFYDRKEMDEDELFLLSLVPSLRRLSTEKKMDAKIEILKIIRSFDHMK